VRSEAAQNRLRAAEEREDVASIKPLGIDPRLTAKFAELVERRIDQVLQDEEFVKWLIQVGILVQDEEDVIDKFISDMESIDIPKELRRIFEAYKPFRIPLTYRLMCLKLDGYISLTEIHRLRVLSSRLFKRLKPAIASSGININNRGNSIIKGLGFQPMTFPPGELIISRILLQASESQPVTAKRIAAELYDDEYARTALHPTTAHLSNIRKHLPEGLELAYKQVGNLRSFYWRYTKVNLR
jgi:hypothetical protein